MIPAICQTTEEILTEFFNGKLEQIAKKMYQKKDDPLPEELYYLGGSIDYSNVRVQTSHISDITADTAIKLADIHFNRVDTAKRYNILINTIAKEFQALTPEEKDFLLGYLNIIPGGVTEAAKKNHRGTDTARKILKQVILKLKTVIAEIDNSYFLNDDQQNQNDYWERY